MERPFEGRWQPEDSGNQGNQGSLGTRVAGSEGNRRRRPESRKRRIEEGRGRGLQEEARSRRRNRRTPVRTSPPRAGNQGVLTPRGAGSAGHLAKRRNRQALMRALVVILGVNKQKQPFQKGCFCLS